MEFIDSLPFRGMKREIVPQNSGPIPMSGSFIDVCDLPLGVSASMRLVRRRLESKTKTKTA